MSKKPNAFWHMIRWGFGSGAILAFLYMAFIVPYINPAYSLDRLRVFLEPSLWAGAIVQGGGTAGITLGFLDGLLLWALMRNVPIPFTRKDMQAIRYIVYGAMALPATVIGFLITWLVLDIYSIASIILWLLLPLFIAAIAAAYAAHRYLFRLRLWSEGEYGAQKEKAKHFERLEDKPKQDSSYFEEEAESHQHETS